MKLQLYRCPDCGVVVAVAKNEEERSLLHRPVPLCPSKGPPYEPMQPLDLADLMPDLPGVDPAAYRAV